MIDDTAAAVRALQEQVNAMGDELAALERLLEASGGAEGGQVL